MRIYRKVIPKIAKDTIRSLLAAQAIEVEDGRRDEAELDIAAVIVEYLNALDKLHVDAQEALTRHNLPPDMLGRVKRSLAENRKIVLGEGALEHVIERVIESLFNSKNIEEIFAEDNDIRRLVAEAIKKYLGVDEELDREVRGRLKNLREGTNEWEIEYSRLIEQMRAIKVN